MKKILIIFSVVSCCFSIGLESIDLPSNATELALSGSGSANTDSPYINPAWSLSSSQNQLSFAHNRWLGAVNGSSITYHINKNHFLGMKHWGVDNLELRLDIPSNKPLGYFGVHSLLFSYGSTIQKGNFNLGFLTNLNFNKIINESMFGISLNAGCKYKIVDKLSTGFVIKNIGYQHSQDLRASMHPIFVLGIDYNVIQPLHLIYDIDYDLDDIIQHKIAMSLVLHQLSFFISGQNDYNNEIELSTGFQLKYNKYMLAYGFRYIQQDILGFPHFFQLGYVF